MSNPKPRCTHAPGCFANKEGYCVILKSSNFGDKPCPFHKTKEQGEAEHRLAMERLIAEDRVDLVEKYYGGGRDGS